MKRSVLAGWFACLVLPWTLAVRSQPADGAVAAHLEMISAINLARTDAGLAPLEPEPRLSEIAAWRAQEIAGRSAARSSRKDLTATSRRLLSSGYRARAWSEAVSIGSADPMAVFRHWQGERPDSFRTTALGDYEHIGVALSMAGELPAWSVIVAASEAGRQDREAAPLRDLAAVRRRALARVNEERRRRNRRPLTANDRLDAAAQAYAEEMLRRGFYDHVNPDGEMPADRARRAGYPSAAFLSENIAKGLFTPQEVVERWLNSPGHRRNILQRNATETGLGVAVARVDDGVEMIWVQMVAGPR